MISKIIVRKNNRERRKYRVRGSIFGTVDRPRLSVFRSNKYIYGQVINDTDGVTLADISKQVKEIHTGCTKLQAAKKCGEELGKMMLKVGINKIAFDRNGYKYTGRVKSFADGVRTSGVRF